VQHALCCTHCFEQSAQQTAWRATENKRYMRTCEGHLHFAARCRCQKPCNGAPTVCSAGERLRADRYLQQTWVPTRSGAITTLVALASRALSTSSANADPQVCRRERSLINLNRTVYCRLRQPRTAYPRAHILRRNTDERGRGALCWPLREIHRHHQGLVDDEHRVVRVNAAVAFGDRAFRRRCLAAILADAVLASLSSQLHRLAARASLKCPVTLRADEGVEL
jgi:hypothetical protein